eukprot:2473187-Pyramimonas_sp.AAC.1
MSATVSHRERGPLCAAVPFLPVVGCPSGVRSDSPAFLQPRFRVSRPEFGADRATSPCYYSTFRVPCPSSWCVVRLELGAAWATSPSRPPPVPRLRPHPLG